MKYCIGIDYGTLSARAILINLDNGNTVAESEFKYPHKVMDITLPCGTPVDKNSAFQHPQDYIDALSFTIRDIVKKSETNVNDIVGIGIDFTSCTMLPVDENAVPLCFKDEFKTEPQAYAKLWKHHSAQDEADYIDTLAKEHNQVWLDSYGGKVSSEWMIPKILETLRKAPDVYKKACYFIEAADWLTILLTGNNVLSSCTTGYKGMWNKQSGYPSSEFLSKITPKFKNLAGTKLLDTVLPTGSKAGTLSEHGVSLTGLSKETIVAVPIIDAHASLPAAGISDKKLMLILGTSSCHIVMSKKNIPVKGICGSVEDGIVPGYTAYEAGQACVGDSFNWFIENIVPAGYINEANALGKNIFEYLDSKASALKIGENHLIALDWWNGNRTPYADYDLTGAIIGLNIQTKPEEIYRAMLESTAYGTRSIIELYESNGIEIEEIYATGGISQKNSFLMQLYADIIGKKIIVPDIPQAGAKGSAVLASCACGYYKTYEEATKALCNYPRHIYTPIKENTKAYEKLYSVYKELSVLFGETHRHIMKKLNEL
ncbi:MAG: ribulokinase [Clostridia bacterium]|nr:ribulokinase [Clostridia bacterium]